MRIFRFNEGIEGLFIYEMSLHAHSLNHNWHRLIRSLFSPTARHMLALSASWDTPGQPSILLASPLNLPADPKPQQEEAGCSPTPSRSIDSPVGPNRGLRDSWPRPGSAFLGPGSVQSGVGGRTSWAAGGMFYWIERICVRKPIFG